MGIVSDDRFYDLKVVSDVVDFFQEIGADIITYKRMFVDAETDQELGCILFPKQQRWMGKLPSEQLFQKISSFCFLTGENTYYTKAFYKSMGGYVRSFKYMEDYPFFLKYTEQMVE